MEPWTQWLLFFASVDDSRVEESAEVDLVLAEALGSSGSSLEFHGFFMDDGDFLERKTKNAKLQSKMK